MSGGYAHLFSTYTDEQLLELARQRDALVGAGREALDDELRKRRYDPDDLTKPAPEAAFPLDSANLSLNVVSRFFLRAPSWQIFVMVCVVGFFSSAQLIVRTWNPVNMLALSLCAVMLATVCELGWEWSLGSFLCSATHPELRMKKTFFRVAIGSLLILLPLTIFFTLNPIDFYWMLLTDAPTMVCTFYILYFISKSLVLAERSKPVSFYDYAGPFLMIWFLPIGIWRIQPRINKLYESRMSPLA